MRTLFGLFVVVDVRDHFGWLQVAGISLVCCVVRAGEHMRACARVCVGGAGGGGGGGGVLGRWVERAGSVGARAPCWAGAGPAGWVGLRVYLLRSGRVTSRRIKAMSARLFRRVLRAPSPSAA
jgi:hypothetical protein